MQTHWIFDVITGELLYQVRLSGFSWSMRMNDQIGQGSATIESEASYYDGFTEAHWADILRPWARGIVACWNGVPYYAGPITDEPSYDWGTGRITLPHAEIGELLRKRLYWGAGTYSKTAKKSIPNLSRQGVLVEAARIAAGGAYPAPIEGLYPWRLPIHVPAAIVGTRTLETVQHEFERPWEQMASIPEEINGEDFTFVPGFNTGDGRVQWVMRVGSPALSLSSHEWHLSAGQSDAVRPRTSWDAKNQQTGVFAIGKGIGSEMVVGMATPPTGGVRTPAMDTTVTHKDVGSQTKLNALAAGSLASVLNPVRRWATSIEAAAFFASGIRPGSRASFVWAGNRVMGTGRADQYVVGASGGMSGRVALEVQSL